MEREADGHVEDWRRVEVVVVVVVFLGKGMMRLRPKSR